MEKALIKYKDDPISIPNTIDMVKIDAKTGLLPSLNSDDIIYEAFINGTAPNIFEENSDNIDNIDTLDGQIY